jgi:hypothetical protein
MCYWLLKYRNLDSFVLLFLLSDMGADIGAMVSFSAITNSSWDIATGSIAAKVCA